MSDDDDIRPLLVALDGGQASKGRSVGTNATEDPGREVEPDGPSDGANDEAVRKKLALLEDEHRDLDIAIRTIEDRMPYDRLTIQRLKKRKLGLKDEITALRTQILPDIIA